MAVPVLNFNPFNPMDTAIQTALGTYKGIGEGRGQQLQNEALGIKMPFIGRQAEADIAAQLAMAQYHRAQSMKEQRIAELLRMFGGAEGMATGGSVPSLESGVTPNAAATPSGGAISAMPGMPGRAGMNELGDLFVRGQLGLPDQTPREKAQMDLFVDAMKKQQAAQIEQANPTTATISDTQRRIKGSEGVIPILQQILESDVPPQVGLNLPSEWGSLKIADIVNPNKQAAYKAKLSAAKENALAAMGLTGTEAGLGTIEEIFGRKALEGNVAYRKRLMEEMNNLVRRYEELGGKQKFKKYDPSTLDNAVRVMAPDGSVKLVPRAKLKSALDKGGRRV